MKRLMMCGAWLVALIGLAIPAAAQTTAAVIDVQRVVTDSDPGKESLQRLRTLQDEKIEEGDAEFPNQGVSLLVDPLSFQYLAGAEIDYREDLEGAQFVIRNPNATTTCGCGSSFST